MALWPKCMTALPAGSRLWRWRRAKSARCACISFYVGSASVTARVPILLHCHFLRLLVSLSAQKRQLGKPSRSGVADLCSLHAGNCPEALARVQVTWLPTHTLPPAAQLRDALLPGCAVVVQPLGSACTALATLVSIQDDAQGPHVIVTAATYEAPNGAVAALVAIMVPCVPAATGVESATANSPSAQAQRALGGDESSAAASAAAAMVDGDGHASSSAASDGRAAAAPADMWADARVQQVPYDATDASRAWEAQYGRHEHGNADVVGWVQRAGWYGDEHSVAAVLAATNGGRCWRPMWRHRAADRAAGRAGRARRVAQCAGE